MKSFFFKEAGSPDNFPAIKCQVLEFFKPLTLILGSNGSGKTTVIESLRMMTTGQLPPNAARGASFINDPKEILLSSKLMLFI
jgi:predicted ATPase